MPFFPKNISWTKFASYCIIPTLLLFGQGNVKNNVIRFGPLAFFVKKCTMERVGIVRYYCSDRAMFDVKNNVCSFGSLALFCRKTHYGARGTTAQTCHPHENTFTKTNNTNAFLSSSNNNYVFIRTRVRKSHRAIDPKFDKCCETLISAFASTTK